MHADAHFVVGHAHTAGGKPCQDYALAGDLPGGAFAIVSDGCSSGGRTDVGARIISLAAADALRENWNGDEWPPTAVALRQQAVLAGAGALLGCDASDLLATSLFAIANETERLVQIWGDGVVAWHSGTSLIMARFDWDNNTPYYPAYSLNGNRDFIAAHGGDINAPRLTCETWEWTPGRGPALLGRDRFKLGAGIRGAFWPLEPFYQMTTLAVFSDGVTQIDGVDWKVAVAELMDFKTRAGDFVKRRLSRVVRDSHARGRGPIDDIAMAAIDLTS